MTPHTFGRLALCLSLFALSGAAQTAQPFTGTWKIDFAQVKYSEVPTKYEVGNGTFKCTTCDQPGEAVKTDGTDQPVSGHPSFDTRNIRIVDDRTLEDIGKKAGKIAYRFKYTVASDDATSTIEFANYPPEAKEPVVGKITFKRVEKGPAGMHAISGAWVAGKVEGVNEDSTTITFEQTADGLKMRQATGDHFDAKLDGKPYPYGGNPDQDTVALKQIGPREIEETDRLGTKVISTARLTVSPDGKTLTVVTTEPGRGTSTFVGRKQ